MSEGSAEGRTQDAERFTSADLLRMLHTRHSDPGWAFFAEVPDRTAGHFRRADAVAISLWPSRGLHLHGFEVKVSRRDWLAELKRPEKAESIGKYCDFWWLVVADPSIVEDGELPSAWGLLAPSGNGLRTIVRPTALEPLAISRPFLCSLLRKFAEGQVPRVSIQNELAAEYERGEEAGDRMSRFDKSELVELREGVKAFEEATGLSIRYPSVTPEEIKQVVGVMEKEGAAEQVLARARGRVEELRKVATAIEVALNECKAKDGP